MRHARATGRLAGVCAVAALALPAPADAGVPAVPIPQDLNLGRAPAFTGHPATPHPVRAPAPPQDPYLAPDGASNIHDDAAQSDTYGRLGPLGHDMQVRSTLLFHECASVTFDSRGRIVTVCVGVEGPQLVMLAPRSLALLALQPLPPRNATAGNPFTDFSGGGYFYLDHRDRAVVPTTTRHVYVFAETPGPGFRRVRDYDLTGVVGAGDGIVSALPDYRGRIWFVSRDGVVGTIERASGAVHARDLHETIGNSFAVGRRGVYVVTDGAMYRLWAGRSGVPRVVWRARYPNSGESKPGQTEVGSGSTPTLMGRRYVAITDNADPMDVVVLRRGRHVSGRREVCRQPVFTKGASDTDQSLVATNRAIIVENNYGYTPAAVQFGGTTAPGIARVDVNAGGDGCHLVWTSEVRAPSVVPKLSLPAGLLYTYTKPPSQGHADPWYLTALDFRTGATVYRRLAGLGGIGYDNNYAPITIGPDGAAYVGVLGGLVELRDTTGPAASGAGG